MDLNSENVDDLLAVTPTKSRLDAAVAVQFKDRFRDVLTDSDCPVILDMSGVTFLDSSGLGALVAVMKLAGPDRTLVLFGLTEMVERVFKLTRMDAVFQIEQDRAAAARRAVPATAESDPLEDRLAR